MNFEKQMLLEIDLPFRARSWGQFGTCLEGGQVGGRESRWEGARALQRWRNSVQEGRFGDTEEAW